MDFIIKFTIGLFIFSIMLLFFKSTKKLSENYYDKSLVMNDIHEKKDNKPNKQYDINSIKFKIKN